MSMEAGLGKTIKNIESKLVKNSEISALSATQKNTAQVEVLIDKYENSATSGSSTR